jgi:hypothetical protein
MSGLAEKGDSNSSVYPVFPTFKIDRIGERQLMCMHARNAIITLTQGPFRGFLGDKSQIITSYLCGFDEEQELNSLVTSCDKARTGGKMY